tara:strand:+ start:25 stop:864 length:840 start_codon:yes stop_codon:yes gene_type:complete
MKKYMPGIIIFLIATSLSGVTLIQARDGVLFERGVDEINDNKEETITEQVIQEDIKDDSVRNVVRSVVYIEVWSCPSDGISDAGSSGSGSLIDRRGLILTNHHVVAGCRGDILIGTTESPDSDPEVKYIAEMVAFDKDLDIAVLNITKYYSNKALFNQEDLPYLTIGDSDYTSLGDNINVWGYPGSRAEFTGQARINLTKGTISGIDAYKGFKRGWLISDVNITWGNSGGAALNSENELIGIPSEGRGVGAGAGILGALRPINIALDTIQTARNVTGKK